MMLSMRSKTVTSCQVFLNALIPLLRKNTSPNKVSTREHASDHHRGDRTANQRGNSGDTSYSIAFCLPDFPSGKKDGGQRLVVNLNCLNPNVKMEHFEMEGLHLLPDLLQIEDWMVKLDSKDAFLQVQIHPGHQHLLTFQWEGRAICSSAYHLACHQHQECLPNY